MTDHYTRNVTMPAKRELFAVGPRCPKSHTRPTENGVKSPVVLGELQTNERALVFFFLDLTLLTSQDTESTVVSTRQMWCGQIPKIMRMRKRARKKRKKSNE